MARLLALLVLVPPLAAQGIAYTPGNRHYREVTVTDRVDAAEGTRHQNKTTIYRQVTVALTPKAKDTLAFSVTLDSMSLESTLAVKLPDVSKYKGTAVSGTMSPSGKVLQTRPPAGADAQAQSIAQSLSRFLLALPPNASTGATWVDTISKTEQQSGGDITTTSIVTSRIEPDTQLQGGKAFRISRATVLTLKGTAVQGNEPISVQGDGTGQGMYYISDRGVFLAATADQKMNMTIDIPSRGMKIPVMQTVRSTTELLP